MLLGKRIGAMSKVTLFLSAFLSLNAFAQVKPCPPDVPQDRSAYSSRWAVIDNWNPNEDGLYTVSGDAKPDGANAWYEPQTGRLTSFGGRIVEDYLSVRYSIPFRPINPNLVFRTPPVGWMTWYAVKFDASDEVVLRNARAFKEKFGGYTDEKPVLWVDWEWFHGRFEEKGDETETDMLTPRKDVYPRGLKAVADDLKALGFTPALWVSVFSDVRTNALWKAHPEWVLGEKMTWCGAICGNPSAPGFCEEFVPQLFSLYRSWGYEAFKWDTVPVAFHRFADFKARGRPVGPPAETLRKCAAAVRKAVGDDCYVMSCSGEYDHVNLAAIDIFDGGRIGGDIFSWNSFRVDGVNRILSYLPFHNTVFWADADNLVLRKEFSSEAQARTRVSIYVLAGVPITLGDEIAALDDARIDMLRKAMPVVRMRPASMSRGAPAKDLLPLRADFKRDFGVWQIRGWSNLTTNRTLSAEFAARDCAVWDFWNDRLVWAGKDERRLAVTVEPGDTTLYRVTPLAKDAPTLVSVSRHVTQGGYELKSYAADANGATGTVRCPGGETVKVTFLLPEGMSVRSASHPYDLDGRVIRLKLSSKARQDIAFRLELTGI